LTPVKPLFIFRLFNRTQLFTGTPGITWLPVFLWPFGLLPCFVSARKKARLNHPALKVHGAEHSRAFVLFDAIARMKTHTKNRYAAANAAVPAISAPLALVLPAPGARLADDCILAMYKTGSSFLFFILLFSLVIFSPVTTPAQTITSYSTTVFPGTDSAVVLQDTVTIDISQESQTIEFTSSSGTRIYTITSVVKGKRWTRYYLSGGYPEKGIVYLEIRHEFLLVAFENAPNQPIMLTNQKL
jgi:hypothetical protein